MKILLVSQYYYPERFSVSDIAEEMVRKGNDVTVVTGKPNYGYQKILDEYKNIKYEEINGVKVHRVNLCPRKYSRISIINNYLSFHFNAKRYIRTINEQFDVVLSFSLSPVISISPALLYSKLKKVPCVLYCQDLWPESTLITKAVRKHSLIYKILFLWSKHIYSRCDKIVISSPSFKEYFDKELKIFNKGFDVVYQPIIESKVKNEPIRYPNKYNLVYAGNIGKIQLTDKLIEAMKKVKTDDVKLHLIGMGSELKKIKKLIVENNLENKVIYEGAFPIEKAEQFYWNADALIVALKDDGYVGKTIPNKAIQYMKYGRPILCIAKGDTYELFSKSKGALFSEQNAENIAENIDKLCKLSEKEKCQLGINNKAYFDNNFTLEKLTNYLLDELTFVKK